MGNAGEARLDVVALGRDEMTAAVNKVNAELDAMKAKLRSFEAAQGSVTSAAKASTGSVGGFGAALGRIKEGVSPVDKVRGVFENLKANVLGFPMAIGGMVAGLVTLVQTLTDAGSAAERLRERSDDYAKALATISDEIDRLRVLNGKETEAEQKRTKEQQKVQDAAADLNDKISTLSDALQEAKDRWDNLAHSQFGWLAKSKGAYLEIAGLQNDLNAAIAERVKLENEAADALTRSVVMAGALGAAKGGVNQVTVSPFDMIITGTPPKPPSGGRPPDLLAEWNSRRDRNLAELQRGPDRNADRDWRALQRNLSEWNPEPGPSALSKAASGANFGKIKQAIDDQRRSVKELVDQYTALAGAIGSLAGPLSGLSSQLGTVASTLSSALGVAAQFAAGDYIGGIAGILGGVISLFSDTHQKARGIINQADRELSAARSSGPSTIIINVGPGSDPQSVAKAVRQNAYSTRGTGNDARAPGV